MGRARGHGSQHQTAAGRGPRRRGTPYRWTFERIHEELDGFLGERKTWPTQFEFEQAGRRDLLEAVTRHGGIAAWSGHMAVELASGQDRSAYPLGRQLDDARALIAAHGRLPGEDKLRALGHNRLATEVKKAGGARAYCDRHGLR